jgi:sigma-B regulation protein RsbU (phosphoserine phosphatase)
MSRALDESDRKRRFEMAKARCIQDHLLPRRCLVNGLNLAHLYRPASDVGGDYFDVLPISDGSWLFCIADVTGHGVAAAMEAVILKTLLLGATEKHTSVDSILSFVNDRFTAVCFPEHFASMLLVRWKPQDALLEYASAGHETAYLVNQNGGIAELRATGPLIGLQEYGTWNLASLSLDKGDRLFLVTDGIVETEDPNGKYFGRDKLKGILVHSRHAPLEAVVQELNEALAGHQRGQPGHDDVTLLAIEFSLVGLPFNELSSAGLVNTAGRLCPKTP